MTVTMYSEMALLSEQDALKLNGDQRTFVNCVRCGKLVEVVLARLGSTTCHDCRPPKR